MVCHVGPGAGLVQLEQGNRVERGATPHAGSLAACSAMANIIYGDLADGGGVPTAMRDFNFQTLRLSRGCSTTGANAIVHFGSVGRLQGLFERYKAHPARG